MNLAVIISAIVGIGGLAVGAFTLRATLRRDDRDEDSSMIEAQTADRLALIQTVETLQQFQEKFTGDLRVQVEKLIVDKNMQRAELDALGLRESECQVELKAVKVVQRAQALELADLRRQIGGGEVA